VKRETPKRDYRSLALSLALHVVLGAFVLNAAVGSGSMLGFFRGTARRAAPAAEKVIYVPLPRGGADSTRRQADGGNNRVAAPNVSSAAPLRAPVSVPSMLPPATPAAPQAGDQAGSGPLVGGGGPLRGVQPSYADPRVWTGPGPLVGAPKTEDERRDSVVAQRLSRYRDSLAVATAGAEKPGPPSWVLERNGEKYGIDQKYIRLGKFSLPTAILAALPFNTAKYTNPIAQERLRKEEAIRLEINEQAQRRMNEAEFRTAVKNIRERKERERKESEKKPDVPSPVANGTH
jgi:hypothetical protein